MRAGQIAVAVFFLLGALGAFMMHRRGESIIFPGLFHDYIVDPRWIIVLIITVVVIVVV